MIAILDYGVGNLFSLKSGIFYNSCCFSISIFQCSRRLVRISSAILY